MNAANTVKNGAQAGIIGTAIVAAIAMKDWFITLPMELQVVTLIGFFVTLFAGFYFIAVAKKKWGIDPSDVVRELKEILEVLKGIDIPTPVPMEKPIDKPVVVPAVSFDNGLVRRGAFFEVVDVEKALKHIVVVPMIPEAGVEEFKYNDSFVASAKLFTSTGTILSLNANPFYRAPEESIVDVYNKIVEAPIPYKAFYEKYGRKAELTVSPWLNQLTGEQQALAVMNSMRAPREVQVQDIRKHFKEVTGWNAP